MKRRTALVAVVLIALSGCGGGDDGGDGAGTPQNVLACLKDEHGLRAALGPKNAADATRTVEVAIKDPPQAPPRANFPPIVFIDFFPDAALAKSYVEAGAVGGYARRLVAQTITANYVAGWGLRGPPELENVKDCLGS